MEYSPDAGNRRVIRLPGLSFVSWGFSRCGGEQGGKSFDTTGKYVRTFRRDRWEVHYTSLPSSLPRPHHHHHHHFLYPAHGPAISTALTTPPHTQTASRRRRPFHLLFSICPEYITSRPRLAHNTTYHHHHHHPHKLSYVFLACALRGRSCSGPPRSHPRRWRKRGGGVSVL